MNPPSKLIKYMFSTGHPAFDVTDSQCQQNSVMCSVAECNFSFQCNKLKKKVPFQTRKR